MDREDAIRLLTSGEDGIKKWNALGREVRLGIDLSATNLRGCNLQGTNFQESRLYRADLREANLQGANFKEACLHSARLNGANIERAKLSSARMQGAILFRADLRGAQLHGANLLGANLSEANLEGANLEGANLAEASLRDANLANANLERSSFRRTRLENANLANAVFGWSSFSNVELSKAKGLGQSNHIGPSSLGTDTLIKSKGDIPEEFLRGCGLAEEWIMHVRTLIEKTGAVDSASCFISYCQTDERFALQLHGELQTRGIRCWLDKKQDVPSDNILDRNIEKAAEPDDKVLLCASKDSITSRWVKAEVGAANGKEKRIIEDGGEAALAIIPLNLDGHLFDWTWFLGADLRERLVPDFSGWETDNAKFEEQVELLVKALGGNVEKKTRPTGPDCERLRR